MRLRDVRACGWRHVNIGKRPPLRLLCTVEHSYHLCVGIQYHQWLFFMPNPYPLVSAFSVARHSSGGRKEGQPENTNFFPSLPCRVAVKSASFCLAGSAPASLLHPILIPSLSRCEKEVWKTFLNFPQDELPNSSLTE